MSEAEKILENHSKGVIAEGEFYYTSEALAAMKEIAEKSFEAGVLFWRCEENAVWNNCLNECPTKETFINQLFQDK